MKKAILALALALCTLLCACAGGTSNEQQANTAGPAENKGVIRCAWSNVPLIDPAISTDQSSNIAVVNLYDSLVFPNAENEIEPMVATTWEYSEDGMEWTFHLRDDVKFHDGSMLEASDVVFSFNRLITLGQGYSYLFADRVDRCEAIDPQTVKFYLKESFAPFLSTLVRLYIVNEDALMANKKEGSYGDFGDYGTEYLLTGDAGSGAYKVEEMRISDRLIMVRNPDYWQPWNESPVERVEMIAGTESATIRTMMSNQELEISDTYQNSETLDFLSTLPGVEQGVLYQGMMCYGMLNQQLAPLDDVHVRKALAYLADDATITEQIFPGSRIAKSCVPVDIAGYSDNLEQYPYDPEKAKAELEQSKYYGQFDQYPITINTFNESPDMEKIALYYQAAGAELGLQIKVEPIPWTSFVDRIGKVETTGHMTICLIPPDFAEAGSVLVTRFHSSMNGTWQQAEWMDDKDLDARIEDSLKTLDYDARMQKYADLQAYVADQCYCVNLYEEGVRFAYRADLIDWPAVNAIKNGESISMNNGYNYVFRTFTMK